MSALGEPQRLQISGAPDAFYYRPAARGSQPVLMYLHGRGGNPMEDCRRWAKVATQFGWLVCPQGSEDRGAGSRSWNNNPVVGKQIVDNALVALRAKHKGRVRMRGNVLLGFSEGAFIAMQVGVHDPRTWSRWLILGANDQYWFGDGATALQENRRKIERVYLLTGQGDGVAANTMRVGEIIKAAKIPVRVKIDPSLGHEIAADRMVTMYRRPLLWLIRPPVVAKERTIEPSSEPATL